MIPRHYMVKDARVRLKNYVNLYLKEEVKEETLVQNIDTFERFLEVAAVTNTEILNYDNVASDCGGLYIEISSTEYAVES